MVAIDQLSKIGFGAYRVSVEDQENACALVYAMREGCNLVDTSSNYVNGKSELLIGKILRENPAFNTFVITKAGYIQNDNLNVINTLNIRGLALEGLVSINPNLKHSIHPDFLKNQIDTSRKRLERKFIDGFLLHNPEYYFDQPGETSQEEYYDRIKKAFSFLEEKVTEGVIRYYGISSNTFAARPEKPNRTDLCTLLSIAKQVSLEHHFKFIQFPYNLIENEALTAQHHCQSSLISLAKENGIITLANRPLNANYEQGMLRIADYTELIEGLDPANDRIIFESFLNKLRYRLKIAEGDPDIMDFEIISHLDKHWMSIGNPEGVYKLFHEHLYPFIKKLYLGKIPHDIRAIYLGLVDKSVRYSRKFLTEKAKPIIRELICSGRLKEYPGMSIAAMACNQYLDDGIDHVLVGMKNQRYVDDLKVLFV